VLRPAERWRACLPATWIHLQEIALLPDHCSFPF
jgi:hypothetical protein